MNYPNGIRGVKNGSVNASLTVSVIFRVYKIVKMLKIDLSGQCQSTTIVYNYLRILLEF